MIVPNAPLDNAQFEELGGIAGGLAKHTALQTEKTIRHITISLINIYYHFGVLFRFLSSLPRTSQTVKKTKGCRVRVIDSTGSQKQNGHHSAIL